MSVYLQYGPGDLHGIPYRLDPFQQRFLDRLYVFDGDRRVVRRALLGVAKGDAKTELAAAIAWFEFAGPCLITDGTPHPRIDPDIPIGAASSFI